jgi:hypothetical protein
LKIRKEGNMTDYFGLRINKELKESFYEVCKSKGLTAGKAIKLFAREFSKSEKMPFSLIADRTFTDNNLVRISIHMDALTRQKFSNVCEDYGLPMSVVVRGFMDYCVQKNDLPFDVMNRTE